MDPNPQDIRFGSHKLMVGISGLMVQTFAQAAGSSIGNKIRMGIALGALAMNVLISRWVTDEENKLINFIFNLTWILPIYLAYSMLMPEWFTWVGFAVICIILTIFVFHEEIKEKLTGPYKNCVDAIKDLRDNLPKRQVPANVDV